MAITVTTAAIGSSQSTATLALGFTANAGDLVLVAAGEDGAGTVTWPASPWAEIKDQTFTGGSAHVGYLIAAGGETAVVLASTVSDRWEACIWRIPAGEWHGTTPPEINTGVTGNNTAPDPGAIAPSWSVETNNIFVALAFRDDSAANTITAYPTNYGTAQADKNDTTSACNVGGAVRIVTGTNENPGAFTISATETWIAYTVAIRPAGAPEPVTGSGGVTIPAVALSGSGAETFTGSGGVTLPAPSLSGTAAETFSGSGGVSLPAPAMAGTGEHTEAGGATGSGGVTLPASALSGSGEEGFVGSAGATLPAPALAGSGEEGFAGSGGVIILAPSLAGTAEEGLLGNVTVTIPPPALAGTGLEEFIGSVSITLPAPVIAGIGEQGGVAVIGSAVVSFVRSMAATLARLSLHAATLDIQVRMKAALVTTALEYDLNDSTVPTCTFTVNDTPTDPTTISLFVREPDGTTNTYTYAAAQITKDSTGVFSKSISLAKRGIWYFKYTGTGACEAVAEGTVTVRN